MLNLENFFIELDDDKESIKMVLEMYIEEYSDIDKKLAQLYTEKDWSSLHLVAHSLKGILTSFGETEITPKLESIELETHSNRSPDGAVITAVCNALPNIESLISEAISNL